MNRYLVLSDNSAVYPTVRGIDSFSIYKRCGPFLRAIRYLHHKTGLLKSLKVYWLEDWCRRMACYDSILIFDSVFDYTPLEIIRKHNKDVRLIFCFRNRVKEQINHSICSRNPEVLLNKYNCELWSYNDEDCTLYHMKKYNQFHLFENSIISADCRPAHYDVFFMGFDKGRMGDIIKVKNILDSKTISYYIGVVADKKNKYSVEERSILTSPKPYSYISDCIKHCKCILDIVGSVNYGLTYRGLEAMVFQKKLITNYRDIIKESFYNSNNVFIIGVDSYDNIEQFINTPFDESCNKFISEYSYSSFCRRVFGINDLS